MKTGLEKMVEWCKKQPDIVMTGQVEFEARRLAAEAKAREYLNGLPDKEGK